MSRRTRHKIALVIAPFLLVGTIAFTEYLERNYAGMDWRYWVHQWLHNIPPRLKGRPLQGKNTVIILIDDAEFWHGSFAGRTPINTESLGQLVQLLESFEPKVIGLDFALSSPTVDGSIVENEKYKAETKAFHTAISAVAKDKKIVLTKVLHVIKEEGQQYFIALPNRFDLYGADIPGVTYGHINLPRDFRFIPFTVISKDGAEINSFAGELVQAFDLPGTSLPTDDSEYYCGGYIQPSKFVKYSPADLRTTDEAKRAAIKEKIGGKIVIVGGAWTKGLAADPRSAAVETVDSSYTPAGTMPAVFMHANWVESLLADRVGKPVPHTVRWALEFLVSLSAFLLFRNPTQKEHKVSRIKTLVRILFFPVVAVGWFFASYVFFENLGLFIDPLIGLVGLLLAFLERALDRIMDWQQDAKLYRQSGNATSKGNDYVLS